MTRRLQLPPPLPNPEWVWWDHDGPREWPPNAVHDTRPGADSVRADLVAIARRARRRLLRAGSMRHVLGHADWEAQNLRWHGHTPYVVHDWDSVAWLPEPALVGAAAGAFASTEIPTLAPLASSEAFLVAYQEEREFTADELEVAWTAILWPALHNARAEILWNHPQSPSPPYSTKPSPASIEPPPNRLAVPRTPSPPFREPPSSMDIQSVGGLPTENLMGQPPNSRGQLVEEF
ncbi:hypothetical protein [Kribbella yunnanensis]|uniref:hypothetical protein n=1 Tax=Kribbella yunnanensis TaxID=190194 RepID=UPI0031D9F718